MIFFVRVFFVSVLAGVLSIVVGIFFGGILEGWIARLHLPNYLLAVDVIPVLALMNAVFFSSTWPSCGVRIAVPDSVGMLISAKDPMDLWCRSRLALVSIAVATLTCPSAPGLNICPRI
jgi:hypothetical protein